MRVFLLAAGTGSRLKPITNHIPKCLVPINGKPLLEYWLENLSHENINKILINTNYLHEQVEEYIKQSAYSNIVTLSYESKLLNTASSVLHNRKFFQDEPFILIHADNLSFFDINKFIDTFNNRPKGCEITMMTFNTDDPLSCGIVETKETVVIDFHEKVKYPPSNLANAAIYICSPKVIEFIETINKNNIDFSKDVIPNFLGKINTYYNGNYHRDIGTPQSYSLAQIEIYDRFKAKS